MFGFYRIATAVPRMQVADVRFNTEQIIDLIKQGIHRFLPVPSFPAGGLADAIRLRKMGLMPL